MLRWVVASSLIIGVVACSSNEPARAQLVVVVDTDLPTRGQADADPTISGDIAVDSLRVDVLQADGTVIDFRDFIAPDALDWPISFGVLPSPTGGFLTLRMRVFSGAHATPGTLNGATTIEPPIETTIDRVVTLPFPQSGVSSVQLLLAGDCIGQPSSFVGGITTCANASNPHVDPTFGVNATGDTTLPPSVVGSWSLAHEVPCTASPPTANPAICIPGGLSVLGDEALDGVIDGISTAPRRLVRMSPYYLDLTELTVGRYRQLLLKKKVTETPTPDPTEVDPTACTFAGTSVTSKDKYPLNCITYEGAREACVASGGTLPSEAQYEHAARGRGQGRRYPWGDDEPTCCALCIAKDSPLVPKDSCTGALEIAGSHPTSDSCAGLGDQSRDGVLDLAGSLSEFSSDEFASYSSSCWGWVGYATDPVCNDGVLFSKRGSNWSGGLDTGAAAFRDDTTPNSSSITGFRCAYKGAP